MSGAGTPAISIIGASKGNMNKKQNIEKAVRIRSELVMFCGEVPEEISTEIEELLPKMNQLIDHINNLPGKG